MPRPAPRVPPSRRGQPAPPGEPERAGVCGSGSDAAQLPPRSADLTSVLPSSPTRGSTAPRGGRRRRSHRARGPASRPPRSAGVGTAGGRHRALDPALLWLMLPGALGLAVPGSDHPADFLLTREPHAPPPRRRLRSTRTRVRTRSGRPGTRGCPCERRPLTFAAGPGGGLRARPPAAVCSFTRAPRGAFPSSAAERNPPHPEKGG